MQGDQSTASAKAETPPGIGLGDYLTLVGTEMRRDRDRFTFWIIAGITHVNRRYPGRIYLTLIDADHADQGKGSAARVNAVLYAASLDSERHAVAFDAEKGPFRAGQKVLVRVAPEIDGTRGVLKLQIFDVNTSYTLGELVSREIETRNRLIEERLLETNQLLSMPRRINRIAVIAPQASKGLADFIEGLSICEMAGLVEIGIIDAVFQGERAKGSIPAAFQLAIHGGADMVFLIRGGGDAQDLAVLSEYPIAQAVCRCPVPVWTGLGHENDAPVAQQVAHRAFGTPSKAAQGLVERYAKGAERLLSAIAQIRQHGVRLADQEATHLRGVKQRLRGAGASLADRAGATLVNSMRRVGATGLALAQGAGQESMMRRRNIRRSAADIADAQSRRLGDAVGRIGSLGAQWVFAAEDTLQTQYTALKMRLGQRLDAMQRELEWNRERARAARLRRQWQWIAGVAIAVGIILVVWSL